jgi:type IV secretion system protein TrbL
MSMILTEITQRYHHAAGNWHTYLFPMAQHLFGLLATIEIAWSGLLWAINRSDVESLWVEFFKKMLTIGFFYTLLVYAEVWLPMVIQSFVQMGAGASGITALYPSDILDQGISVASSVMQPLLNAGLLHAGIGLVIGSVTALIVLLSFALIAAELVVSLVESYIVVSAGIILLGFAGNRFTSQYSSKYLNYAISVGVKLFVLYLIIGVGSTLATNWGQLVIQGGAKNMSPFMEVMGGALVFLYVAKNIPNKAESLLSGTINLSGSGLAAVATGAAFMASRSAINTGHSSMEAFKQASMVSGHHGHSTIGMIKGAVTAGTNLAVSAVGQHSGLYRTLGTGMAQRTHTLDRALTQQQEIKAAHQEQKLTSQEQKPTQ